MTAKAGGEAGMASGFNSLVWTAMDLFIRVDNAEEFYGTWKEQWLTDKQSHLTQALEFLP